MKQLAWQIQERLQMEVGMAKSKRSEVPEVQDMANSAIPEVGTEVLQNETPKLEESSPEVLAKRETASQIEAVVKEMLDALKAKKLELKDVNQEIKAMLAGSKVRKSNGGKFTFVGAQESIDSIKTPKGKPLSFQAKLLLQIFTSDLEAGQEKTLTREELLAKLEENNYPCMGDKMDNFSWYKSQVFKPLGLMK